MGAESGSDSDDNLEQKEINLAEVKLSCVLKENDFETHWLEVSGVFCYTAIKNDNEVWLYTTRVLPRIIILSSGYNIVYFFTSQLRLTTPISIVKRSRVLRLSGDPPLGRTLHYSRWVT